MLSMNGSAQAQSSSTSWKPRSPLPDVAGIVFGHSKQEVYGSGNERNLKPIARTCLSNTQQFTFLRLLFISMT